MRSLLMLLKTLLYLCLSSSITRTYAFSTKLRATKNAFFLNRGIRQYTFNALKSSAIGPRCGNPAYMASDNAVPSSDSNNSNDKVTDENKIESAALKTEIPRWKSSIFDGNRYSTIQKRWFTGLSLGAIATLWIFSGNGYFTLGFLLTTVIAQLEYYTMVKNTGVQPATKIGLLSSLVCYTAAAMFPAYHELVLPLSVTLLMIWLLIFKKKSSSISEISTTFLGMVYIGYLPSFWVRLRALGEMRSTLFPALLQHWGWTRADTWTHGAIVTWWTWTSIVFADVGAYFAGKKFGKNKLSTISSAAGFASPNKTVEGAVAGFLSCMFLSIIGAFLMQWPLWFATGGMYGLLMGVIALVGDLTASMMKRDAGMKDSGNILPGHGGLLDRIDSYMLTAPAAFFFCSVLLPFAQKVREITKLGFGAA